MPHSLKYPLNDVGIPLPHEEIEPGRQWFKSKGWKPQPFQLEAWKALPEGRQGLLNAPTGSGKTYALLLPALLKMAKENNGSHGPGLIWITPIRALAREIEYSALQVISDLKMPLKVGVRTGDTPARKRQEQAHALPQVLITTPESLHLLLAQKNREQTFGNLKWLVADEWHELMGTKRGVMLELALAVLRILAPGMRTWGISATIGNLPQAMEVLLGPLNSPRGVLIRSDQKKKIEVLTLMPEKLETLPWAGHLGARMVRHAGRIIAGSRSTLLFTNVRSQCEWWYQQLLTQYPALAGQLAIHHGSLDKKVRHWVEEGLAEGRLKAVVCTSSLDLGVDFGPVQRVIQLGGPKGVARFIQRAGRSGHKPGATSRIYFLPTHSLELLEAAALRQAIAEDYLESREPYVLCFDVLVQFIVTMALGDGFNEAELQRAVAQTHCFSEMNKNEWQWALAFVTTGGRSLGAYPEFHKVVLKDGRYRVTDARIARRHRMSIGAIVSDTMMAVRLGRNKTIGHIEESFITSLNEGDAFWFAGQCLELVEIKGLVARVKPSAGKHGRIPTWQGGRLPLSSNMSDMLRRKMEESAAPHKGEKELEEIQPLIQLQRELSHVPARQELLIELYESDDGHHAIFYPFEGRFVHEGLASLTAWRLARLTAISLSMAYNDYGFELLSDRPIPVEEALTKGLLDVNDLESHLLSGINAAELARRRFRDIAAISGLIFKGYPGQPVKERHLQASASLIYQVFEDYDPENLLVRQSYDEVLNHQLEIKRMRTALHRISQQRVVIKRPSRPTPFAFPIMVDRLRERMSSESLEERIRKMSIV